MLPQLELDTSAVAELLTGFVRDEILRTGHSRAVIGLSGGVDSAVSAFLTAAALGTDNLFCVMMPYRTSSDNSLAHAQRVVEQLGIRSETVEITPMVDPLVATDPSMSNVRRGNIMARTRMIILYDRSVREEGLVVGTGNKTETLLGYSTLFGDSACAINPLGDLYKTQVWALARHLGVPDVIIDKAPSADLWTGQTDEDELGFSYSVADEILYFMFDEGMDDAQLQKQGFDASLVKNVRRMVQRNEFKRLPSVIAKVHPTK
jgi:NAD+ synthase